MGDILWAAIDELLASLFKDPNHFAYGWYSCSLLNHASISQLNICGATRFSPACGKFQPFMYETVFGPACLITPKNHNLRSAIEHHCYL